MSGLNTMVGQRRNAHLSGLVHLLESDVKGKHATLDVGAWAERIPIVLDGHPFSFHRHEYLRQPYADLHPHIIWMKAAQMGCTTWALLRSIYLAQKRRYRGVLYLFPSKSDVLDFSKSRLTPMIEDNPHTLGHWVRDTNAAGIKQIGETFFYLRGMVSRVGLKSIPVDMVIFDELDEAPQRNITLARERMGHSEYKEQMELSNPTLPDYGIDKSYQDTDQNCWYIKCEACGEWTCLDKEFPTDPTAEVRCLIPVNGRVIRACKRCEREIHPDHGQWIADFPSVKDKRGYHISQLCSYYVDPSEVLREFRTTEYLANFFNLKLGRPYVEAKNRLQKEEVLALCSTYGMMEQGEKTHVYTMGVDQGKDLHVIVSDVSTGGLPRAVYIGTHREFGDLYRLMDEFRVGMCVIDAQPETRLARRFTEAYKGRAFMCYYSDVQRGSYKWNEEERIVTVNRTESLDASHRQIVKQQYVLPRRIDVVEEFAQHLHNVARKLEEDEDGSQSYVYVKLGPDHFRHAFNYDAIARLRVRGPISYESVSTKRMSKEERESW